MSIGQSQLTDNDRELIGLLRRLQLVHGTDKAEVLWKLCAINMAVFAALKRDLSEGNDLIVKLAAIVGL